ncbi:MAG TPA: hypothetical protein PLI09_03160 [Candidatus Hydrogenedentes bacterium]|nr:hypothetical protein [Candidatus Hydrogenedentota bacterium]
MRSPFIALCWALWLRTRWYVLGIAGACLGATLLFFIGSRIWATPSKYNDFVMFDFLISAYFLAGFSTVTRLMLIPQQGGASKEATPGSYVLTMPVPTFYVTIVSLIYVILVVGIIACGVAVLNKELLGSHSMIRYESLPFTYWQYPFLCVYEALLLQSFLFLIGVNNEAIVLTGMLGIFVLMGAGLVLFKMDELRAYAIPLWLIGAVVACGVSHTGIRHLRCQRRERLMPKVLDLFRIGSGRTAPFTNVDRALTWYAWRRYGWLFLALTISALLFECGRIWVLTAFDSDIDSSPALNIIENACVVIAIASLLFGFLTIPLDMQDFLKGSSLLLILPMRSLRLAWSILLFIAGELTLVVAVVALLLLGMLRMTLPLESWNNILFLEFAAYAVGCIGCSWIAIWLALPLFYVYLLLLCMTGILSYFIYFFMDSTAFGMILRWGMSPMIVLIGIGVVTYAWKKGYLIKRNLAYMTAAFLLGVCAAGIITAYCHIAHLEYMTSALYVAIFSTTILLPLPFVVIPALIDLMWHR